MKKPEYTAGVVSVYRKYLDKYLSGEKKADRHQRGQTDAVGYL